LDPDHQRIQNCGRIIHLEFKQRPTVEIWLVREKMSSWIHLTDGKRLSRLLYTNPVCFLCVHTVSSDPSHETNASFTGDNVMVLSWLTATNNEGNFVFSLCNRRFTASLMEEGTIFTLSVPVQGMENLVRNVGGISGRFGSKFPAQNHQGDDDGLSDDKQQSVKINDEGGPFMSKRQKRKHLRQNHFIPGLRRIHCFGGRHEHFVIEGTVAHLLCTVAKTLSEYHLIDNEHTLFVAKILEANVHPTYWNNDKNLFRPSSDDDPPYLTFFGSQTFGYVTSGSKK
jgi:flavin reductase (DIM6/NTAB) family NADH-FMN oxidoreductase RutF